MNAIRIKKHLSIETEKTLNRHKIVWNKCALNYVEKYDYTENNIPIIINLIKYINGNQCDYDLNKGILICGTVGTGKTFLFKILQLYANITKNPNAFRIESVETMKMHFEKYGHFNYYNQFNSYLMKHGLNLVINEFGIDYDASFYGTKFIESFSAFMMVRYELFENHQTLTHITTNLNLSDLNQKLDPALLRRFRAMFNIINLNGKSYT